MPYGEFMLLNSLYNNKNHRKFEIFEIWVTFIKIRVVLQWIYNECHNEFSLILTAEFMFSSAVKRGLQTVKDINNFLCKHNFES